MLTNPFVLRLLGPMHNQRLSIINPLGLLSRDSLDLERVIAVWYTGRQSAGEAATVSIARRDDGRWRARYRDPAGREHPRHFYARSTPSHGSTMSLLRSGPARRRTPTWPSHGR